MATKPQRNKSGQFKKGRRSTARKGTKMATKKRTTRSTSKRRTSAPRRRRSSGGANTLGKAVGQIAQKAPYVLGGMVAADYLATKAPEWFDGQEFLTKPEGSIAVKAGTAVSFLALRKQLGRDNASLMALGATASAGMDAIDLFRSKNDGLAGVGMPGMVGENNSVEDQNDFLDDDDDDDDLGEDDE